MSGKELVVHPHSKTPTRNPRLGHLEHGCADLPSFADQRTVHIDALQGEVLAKLTVRERTAELLLPPPVVLHRVGVERFVRSAVHLTVRLLVSLEIHASSSDPASDR